MTESSLSDLWRSTVAANRLAAAWAVVAPPERYGAVTAALADALSLSSVDVITVEPEDGKRTLARARVATWLQQAQLTPRGSRQLAVLRSAEMMPPVVANILLKTLEEPPAGTVFLLLMSRDALLPTIRSRVQLLTVDGAATPVDSLPDGDLSAMLKWASGAADQDAWPRTMAALLTAVRGAVRDGRLTGSAAERALELATSTTAGLNRKLQLAALLSQINT